jgi:flagella synthesis protein FlgN
VDLTFSSNPAATLDQEVVKLEEFIDILNREQELLTKADTDALLPLIDVKNGLANALTDMSQNRESLLAKLGKTANRAGMEAWLSEAGTPLQKQSWHKLLQLAAEARTINEINGKLIKLHLQQHQQAFAALMTAANRAMTYGPDGQQQTGFGSRILGTA